MKIGIIGYGVVGSAVANGFQVKGYNVLAYDIDKSRSRNEFSEVLESDIVFLCLPTPDSERGVDLSALYETVKKINATSYKGIVIIKSTIPPGTTDSLHKAYPNLRLVHNPEFLIAASAFNDFLNQDRIVIGGYNKKDLGEVRKVLRIFSSNIIETVPKVSETVKYMANCFLAMKVIFANEFYDACQKLGIDYEEVKKIVTLDKRIGASHLNVPGSDGLRGYGGMCFPKDVHGFVKFCENVGLDPKLMKTVHELNKQLRQIEVKKQVR